MAIALHRPALRHVALGFLYFLIASLTIATTRLGGGVAILFVANAILTAFLLTTPRREWRRALTSCGIASAAATALFGFGVVAAPVFSVINMCEAFVAASLYRRLRGRASPLDSTSSFFTFVFAAGIVAPLLSAVGGAAVAALHGVGFMENAVRWFAGHALGTISFAPACLLVLDGNIRRWTRTASRRQAMEAVLLLSLVFATTLAVFSYRPAPLLFLPWLPVIVATFRLGRFGGAVSIGIVALVAGSATLLGFGPVADFVSTREAELQFIQFYLAATVLAILPPAAELAERKSLFERLQASEHRYRLLADHSTDIILDIDRAGRIVFASSAIERIGGYRPEEVVGRMATDLVDPADSERLRAAHLDVLASPALVETIEYRAIRRDGTQVWLETRTQGVFDEHGKALGAVSAIRNVEARRERERALATEARTDGLTGALNRRAFMSEIEKAALSQRQQERGCVALFDLDHFKRVNDRLGHAAGDAVLVAFVKLARGIVRDGDVVGRLGGEEFAIFLKGASFDQALRICERLRIACAEEIRLRGQAGLVTVSAGIATLDREPTANVMERADAALYRAKRAGRNRLERAA